MNNVNKNDLILQTAREYIEGLVLTSEPLSPRWNRENVIFKKQPKWNYMDSCIIRALLMYGVEEYDAYAAGFVNAYVDEKGDIPTFDPNDFNLDSVCGAMNLVKLHELTDDERYKKAYEKIFREQLMGQPRLDCGCFWHKAIYPRQCWLDGVYMALPFLAKYGCISGNSEHIDDALDQIKQIYDIMRDGKTGLYYHGYNESREMLWADPKTGLSKEFWLRSNGWLCAGLADLYEITGDGFCGRMLRELCEALEKCMTAEDMLLQLPIHPELSGNYPESSGTLLFAYGAMKGHRMGVCSRETAEKGERALTAVTERYITRENGLPTLKNICLMGGLGGVNNRDGSAEYYLSEPIVENDAKGIAPYLMAAAERELGVRS